ncbi:MAG: prolipoprotein diacylglyceryl transferase [Alphaproteobacteria bacterium]
MFVYPEFLSPVALDLFGFGIRWYSISYILGFIYFYLFTRQNLSYFQLNKKQMEDLFFYMFLAVIIGGRIGYILFYNINFYIERPLDIFKVWEGGMSFHGALFGVVVTSFIFSKKNSIPLFLISDLLSICAPIGIFFGRISNFINQELIGRQTDFIISIRYPGEEITRHISQLYEAIFEGMIPAIILIILFLKKKTKYGILTAIFLINYAVTRFLIEFIRQPDIQLGLKLDFFTQGQILTIPIFLLGFIILYKCQLKQK